MDIAWIRRSVLAILGGGNVWHYLAFLNHLKVARHILQNHFSKIEDEDPYDPSTTFTKSHSPHTGNKNIPKQHHPSPVGAPSGTQTEVGFDYLYHHLHDLS